MNAIIEESKQSASVDQKRKDIALLKNEAEGLLYSVGRTLESYGDKIESEMRASIEKSVEKTREAIKTDDYNKLKESLDGLKEASYKFAEVIYSKQGGASEGKTQED